VHWGGEGKGRAGRKGEVRKEREGKGGAEEGWKKEGLVVLLVG